MTNPEVQYRTDEQTDEQMEYGVGEQRTTETPDGRVIHYTFIGASTGKYTTELTSLLMKYADHTRSAEPTEDLRRRMNKVKASDQLDHPAGAEEAVMRLNNKEREILKKWLEKVLSQDSPKEGKRAKRDQRPRLYKGPRGKQFEEELSDLEQIQEELSA